MIGRRRTQPQHTQHMLCTTATASVTVCSWAVTEQNTGKQSPHLGMRHADADAETRMPITVCVLVCVSVCYSTRSPACLPSCHSAAVNLSVCQSQGSLITIPAGLGDHKNQQKNWIFRL